MRGEKCTLFISCSLSLALTLSLDLSISLSLSVNKHRQQYICTTKCSRRCVGAQHGYTSSHRFVRVSTLCRCADGKGCTVPRDMKAFLLSLLSVIRCSNLEFSCVLFYLFHLILKIKRRGVYREAYRPFLPILYIGNGM